MKSALDSAVVTVKVFVLLCLFPALLMVRKAYPMIRWDVAVPMVSYTLLVFTVMVLFLPAAMLACMYILYGIGRESKPVNKVDV
ncbi:MAG: hypothetical protein GF416_04495 [Candidatus Altiarchaeales archaeon]|nr:hypothetical protein [Candidatus Altiarchaeales archaeon]MBD3416379.1 hypothetical protein [Candidatus Altiarchaeales archaeon]